MKSIDETIAAGISFPLDEVISRYAEDQEISIAAASEHALEAKRYLILCALNPTKPYAMRGPIDEFWHTFVTFTTQYFNFCEMVSGRYLHHIPNTSPGIRTTYRINISNDSELSREEETVSMRQHYVQMLADYETTFQSVPPTHLWPRPGTGDGVQPERCSCACGVCRRECGCIA